MTLIEMAVMQTSDNKLSLIIKVNPIRVFKLSKEDFLSSFEILTKKTGRIGDISAYENNMIFSVWKGSMTSIEKYMNIIKEFEIK
jgi:hypothetical protein